MYGTPGKKFPNRPAGEVAVAACVVDLLAAGNGQAPTSFRLVPAGRFRARDGRPKEVPGGWYIDAQIAEGVLAYAARQKDGFLIDYEHQTLFADKSGKPAPAAGWGDGAKMEWRDGPDAGLYIYDFEWNENAAEAIAAKEYRYISPVIAYHPKTGHVLAILMAAITNYAAIDGLSDLAATAAARFSIESSQQEDDTVNREQLIELLGLAKDATEEQIQQAIVALKAQAVTVTALRGALSIDEQTDIEAAVVALKANAEGEPDPAKYVAVDVVTELKTQVAALTAKINGNEIDDLVEGALDTGKLLPAQEAWARKLGNSDIEALRAYVEEAQPIPGLAGSQTRGKKPEGDDTTTAALSADKDGIAALFGNTAEDLDKYGK